MNHREDNVREAEHSQEDHECAQSRYLKPKLERKGGAPGNNGLALAQVKRHDLIIP